MKKIVLVLALVSTALVGISCREGRTASDAEALCRVAVPVIVDLIGRRADGGAPSDAGADAR